MPSFLYAMLFIPCFNILRSYFHDSLYGGISYRENCNKFCDTAPLTLLLTLLNEIL